MLKYIKYIAIAAAAAFLPACSDELPGPDHDGAGDSGCTGELIGPCELEIEFDMESSDGRSRANFENPR